MKREIKRFFNWMLLSISMFVVAAFLYSCSTADTTGSMKEVDTDIDITITHNKGTVNIYPGVDLQADQGNISQETDNTADNKITPDLDVSLSGAADTATDLIQGAAGSLLTDKVNNTVSDKINGEVIDDPVINDPVTNPVVIPEENPVVDPVVIPEENPVVDPVVTNDKVYYKMKQHHYNPESWHGKGSAVVLCPGEPKMDSCDIEGDNLKLWPQMDKGRYLYTAFNTKGLSGTLSCTRGNKVYTMEVKGSGMQYGNCSGPYEKIDNPDKKKVVKSDKADAIYYGKTLNDRDTWYFKEKKEGDFKLTILGCFEDLEIKLDENGRILEDDGSPRSIGSPKVIIQTSDALNKGMGLLAPVDCITDENKIAYIKW